MPSEQAHSHPHSHCNYQRSTQERTLQGVTYKGTARLLVTSWAPRGAHLDLPRAESWGAQHLTNTCTNIQRWLEGKLHKSLYKATALTKWKRVSGSDLHLKQSRGPLVFILRDPDGVIAALWIKLKSESWCCLALSKMLQSEDPITSGNDWCFSSPSPLEGAACPQSGYFGAAGSGAGALHIPCPQCTARPGSGAAASQEAQHPVESTGG